MNALFILDCGMILDGCHDSAPGRHWASGVRDGVLMCQKHKCWELLVDMVSLVEPKPFHIPALNSADETGFEGQ